MGVSKLYKLTDSNNQTRGGMQWGEGITHSVPRVKKPQLCTSNVIHAYKSPLLAVFIDPIQGRYTNQSNAHLWVARGVVVVDDQTKVGCFKVTTIERGVLPSVTTEQRAAFGILAACEVYTEPSWYDWANRWLTGENRGRADAAYAAAYAAYAADAAYAAANADSINLSKIAKKAMEIS